VVHGGQQDPVDLALLQRRDGLGGLARLAHGVDHEEQVAGLAGRVVRAADHLARKGSRGDVVADEPEHLGLPRPQAPRHRVRPVAELGGGGADPLAGLRADAPPAGVVERHRSRGGRDTGRLRDVGESGLLGHR
jgi:hypothetical protein